MTPQSALRTELYSYCNCGALESITEAAGVSGVERTTTFEYDTAGRRTGVIYPDSTGDIGNSFTFDYNLLGQLTAKRDSLGTAVETYEYVNQGLLKRTTSPGGQGLLIAYDDNSRPQTVSVPKTGQFLLLDNHNVVKNK